jgi:replicative DNA helicase
MTDDPSILARFADRSVERALLGLILDRRAIPELLRDLEPDDWSDPLNRAIYAAMCALHARGQAIDAGLLLRQVRRDRAPGDLPEERLLSYLQACLNLRPTPGAEQAHVRHLVDLAGKRRLCTEALLLTRDLFGGALDNAALRLCPLAPWR